MRAEARRQVRIGLGLGGLSLCIALLGVVHGMEQGNDARNPDWRGVGRFCREEEVQVPDPRGYGVAGIKDYVFCPGIVRLKG